MANENNTKRLILARKKINEIGKFKNIETAKEKFKKLEISFAIKNKLI